MLMGWNERCAWGVTALAGDTADLFEEKINPDNPEQQSYPVAFKDARSIARPRLSCSSLIWCSLSCEGDLPTKDATPLPVLMR